jgi:simple sugar transport system substrate-binding protein
VSSPIRMLLALLTVLLFGAQTSVAAEKLRVIMVTHGAVTDPFWASVKSGADHAARDFDVDLSYRAPATFDLDAMAKLVTAAAAEKPAGLVVSIPNADKLADPIRAAVAAGVPVISINSGFDVAKSLGVLMHVGQGEYDAGHVAGEKMRQLGGTKALCLDHELGNVALDLRCKGFIDGFGGSVEVLPVGTDPDAVAKKLADALAANAEVDVVLALSASIAGEPAIATVKTLAGGRIVRVATFDTTPAVLDAVAHKTAAFAIDQQPFLQGYLPVQFFALLHRYNVMPVSNVSTGPRLVLPGGGAAAPGTGATTP